MHAPLTPFRTRHPKNGMKIEVLILDLNFVLYRFAKESLNVKRLETQGNGSGLNINIVYSPPRPG